MFVLRRITSENVEVNTVIGESYVLISAERNPIDFEKSLDIMKNDRNAIYGFISYCGGSRLEPLYKKSVYFVMMSNGQTFANVSDK